MEMQMKKARRSPSERAFRGGRRKFHRTNWTISIIIRKRFLGCFNIWISSYLPYNMRFRFPPDRSSVLVWVYGRVFLDRRQFFSQIQPYELILWQGLVLPKVESSVSPCAIAPLSTAMPTPSSCQWFVAISANQPVAKKIKWHPWFIKKLVKYLFKLLLVAQVKSNVEQRQERVDKLKQRHLAD